MAYQSGPPRRLVRNTRERMIAGVSGGLSDYFDVDPVVMRLLWVAAAVLTSGLAIPAYIVLWILVPRDDRFEPGATTNPWQAPASDLEHGVRAFAEEARGVASEVRRAVRPNDPSAPVDPLAPEGDPAATSATTTVSDAPFLSPALEPIPTRPSLYRGDRGRGRRTAGLILVGLGVFFLLRQAGILWWVEWRYVWPVVLIGVGGMLLLRQRNGRV